MKCPYHIKKKCNWVGYTSDLIHHLADCKFRPTPCPKCNVCREKQNIDRHLNVECDLRPVKCHHCNKQVVHKEMDDHIKICPYVPLDCPNKCSFIAPKIYRKNMENHLKECPLQIVKCDFYKFGYNTKLPRKSLGNHNSTDIEKHLTLLAQAVSAKDKKIADLESKIVNLEVLLKEKKII